MNTALGLALALLLDPGFTAPAPALRSAFTIAAGPFCDAAARDRFDRAAWDLGWSETPSLRFGATRFAREGPWADVSFTRDDGRVIRLWLVEDGGPEPLIETPGRRERLSLRWSLTGPRGR